MAREQIRQAPASYTAAMTNRTQLPNGRAPKTSVMLGMAVGLAFLAIPSLHAQAPGAGPNGNGGPETRLNFGGLANINNNTPKVEPQRVLQGMVRDKEGNGVKGAIVYLKDDKTSAIKSMTADDKGTFRFVQLSRTAEYKVWAQAKDKKSPAKSVSSLDTKDEITRNLNLE